jgi:hypothetical protein
MSFNRRIYLLIVIACISADGYAQTSTAALFAKFNHTLAIQDVFVKQKKQRISNFRNELSAASDLNWKYQLNHKLYDEYKTFSYDSSYSYAKKLKTIAAELRNPAYLADAKMSMAFTLLSSGMFKETLDELAQIDLGSLDNKGKTAFYFLKARCYFDLSDYNRNGDFTLIYDPLGIKCIDSALALNKPGTLEYLELQGLKDLRTGNYVNGEKVYTRLLKLPGLSAHQFAINACCLSFILESKGSKEESLQLLIKAAITDLESATKETVASYKLADIIFKKGDITNSYVYIKQAMDEATYYGALHRQVKISNILPIIEAQWIDQIEHQKKRLYIYSSIITLLVIFVVLFLVIIWRQLKKLKIADDIIKEANASLHHTNEALEEVNSKLSISNAIKNEYIGFYFNINYMYIDKLENFKKSLDKKLTSKRYEDALTTVHNLSLETERQELFNTFDKVFLRMFPDFIEKFNSLFKPEDQFIPADQLMNTELRIFALIRMGIHDNDRISKILGYSVNTIYSYKNRLKTKSLVPNEEFEAYIMEIKAV